MPDIFSLPMVDIFPFSVRTGNFLKAHGIRYIGDVITKTETQLFSISGRKIFDEISSIIKGLGLTFLDKKRLEERGADKWIPTHQQTEALQKRYPDNSESSIFSLPMERFPLSTQAINKLHSNGIFYIGDLALKTGSRIIKSFPGKSHYK